MEQFKVFITRSARKIVQKKKEGIHIHPSLLFFRFSPPILSRSVVYILGEFLLFSFFFFKHKSRRRRSSLFLAYGVCPYGRSLQYKENELGRALVVK